MPAEPYRMPRSGEGWRHYKGGSDSLYEVIDLAVHTETGGPLVIYRAYSETGHRRGLSFARPLDVFLAQVPNPRFDALRGPFDRHIPWFAFERDPVVPAPEDGREG